MARQRITNKRLADLIGVHPNSVFHLKNQDITQLIGADKLEALYKVLEFTLTGLIEYVPEEE